MPDNDDWNFGTGDFTIDTWVYISSHNNSYRGILGNKDGGYILIIDPNNKLQLYSSASGSWTPDVTAPSVFPLSQWVHIAVVRNQGNLYLFQNGTVVDSRS